MKKFLFLVIFATLAINTKVIAQTKTGILQKDHYGAFSGADYETFFQGGEASKFEAKSNIALSDYRVMAEAFVIKELKEKSLESAIANSDIRDYTGEVYTSGITATKELKWFSRTAYPGERGFYHIPTGKYWLSFKCGNICFFGPGPKKVELPTTTKTEYTYTSPGQQSQTQSQSVAVNNPPSSVTNNYYTQTAAPVTSVKDCGCTPPPPQGCGYCGYSNCHGECRPRPMMAAAVQPISGNLNVTVKQDRDIYDVIDAVDKTANTVFNGFNTFRGIRFEQPQVRYINNTPQVTSTGNTRFQGYNQQGNVPQSYFGNTNTNNNTVTQNAPQPGAANYVVF